MNEINIYSECPYCGFENYIEEEYCIECGMRLLPYKNHFESHIDTDVDENKYGTSINTRMNKIDKFSMKTSTKILIGALGFMFFPYVFLAGLIFTIVCIIKKESPIKVIQDWMFERYQNKYYSSDDFLELKDKVCFYIEECNKLNEHIGELKNTHIGVDQTDFGSSNHYDSSYHNYSRPEYLKKSHKNYVYNCSREICDNANKQPFKYVCKYFNIKPTEESLEKFEHLLNNYEAAQDGIVILEKEKNKILNSISYEIPEKIIKNGYQRFQKELGFRIVGFDEVIFPKYTFQYISSGGYASTKCDVVMDIDNLNKFINYLSEIIKFRKSVAGQRALMTSSLRKKILYRDKYTCNCCGNSKYKEPNLLLEIDHIRPLSRGGLTTEDNLQVLCWRCNREKGSKYEENIEEMKKAPDIPKVTNSFYSIPNSNKYSEILDKDIESISVEVKEIVLEEKNMGIYPDICQTEKEVFDMYDKKNGIYPSGEYLVGEDIEIGKYLLISRGDYGGTVTFYENYRSYMKDENLKVIEFDGEYHLSLRENGMFIVVEYADIKKL